MSNMKFTSESGLGDKAELIPQGTLVKAVVTVNAIKQSQATDGRYMQLEFTVSSGIYRNRKIWDLVCDPHDERNSENWRKMGMLALTRAFEAGGVFKHDDEATYEAMEGKSFDDIARLLDGLEVSIKVKVERSSDPAHADKNKVGEWLTPNPKSSGYTGWKKLSSEDNSSIGQAPAGNPQTKFSNPSSGTTPAWLKTPNSGKSNLPF